MHRKRGLSSYILAVCAGLLAGFLITVLSDLPIPSQALVDSTALPWYFQYGETAVAAQWQKADRHWGVLPGRGRSSSLWLHTILPANLPEGTILVLHRPVLDVDVWMDGQPVLSSNGAERNYRPAGTAHYLVPAQAGAELLIHVYSILPFLGLPEPVLLATWSDHVGSLIRSELDELFVMAVLLLIIIGSLVMAFFGSKQFITGRLVAAALAALLYTISQSCLKDLAFPANFLWFCVWLGSLFVLPAAFVGLLEAVVHIRWLRRLRQLVLVFGSAGLLLLAAYLLLFSYDFADRILLALFSYRLFFQLVVVATGVVSLISVFQSEFKYSRRDTRLVGFGLAVFFGACLAQILVAFGSGANGARGNIHLGFMAFLLAGFAVQVLRLLKQKRGYTRAMETLDTYKAALRYSLAQPLLVIAASGEVFYRNEVFLKQFGQAQPLLPANGALVNTEKETALVSLPLNTGGGNCREVEAMQIRLHDSSGCVAYIIQNTDPYTVDHWKGLSAREQAVARCVVQGLSNQEIADRLAISLRTVKAHCTSIFDKLGISSRKELMAGLLVRQTAASHDSSTGAAEPGCAAGAESPKSGRVLLRSPRD